MKKYEFTGETKRVELWNRTATLHRIKATRFVVMPRSFWLVMFW